MLYTKKIFLLLLIVSVFRVNAQTNGISLIPQPAEMKLSNGIFQLTNTTDISYNKKEAQKVAEMFVKQLNTPTGYSLKAKQGKSAAIQLNLNETPDQSIGKEGYKIESSPKAVVITANEPAGLFYGVQTVLQLFPKEIESTNFTKANWAIPAVQITDYPRFGWRGIMLDVSRHFFTKEQVKTYIAQLARFKFNTLHMHLSDDQGWRIEIKSLPKLTEVGAWRVERAGHFGSREEPKPDEKATYGGFYTQDDMKEIIQFAADHHVTIVPEIDVPGHSMALLAAYPELNCAKDPNIKVNPGTAFSEWYGNGTFKMLIDNTLNPADERVFEVLDKIFTEIAAIFPNQYIHVGGDEAYKGYWLEDKGCQELMKKLNIRHVEDLQGYFMNRVEAILKTKGKKMLGWDEIIEGGVSKDATVMSWRGTKYGTEAAKEGHYVVMSPTTFAYLDYYQGEATIEPPIYAGLRLSKSYSFEPVPDEVDPKYILGGQGNLWTEQVPTLRHAEYMTYPRAWALSEVFWSPKEKKDWSNFSKRLEIQFERSDVAVVNYSKAVYDAIVKTYMKDGAMWLELESEMPGLDIYFSADGTMPDRYSMKYSKPYQLPEGPITVRVITYRGNQPIGHLITLKADELKRRSVKK